MKTNDLQSKKDTESIQRLQDILSRNQGKYIAFEDAATIGKTLVDFYEILAGVHKA